MPQNATSQHVLYSNAAASITASRHPAMRPRRAWPATDGPADLAVWLGAALFLGVVVMMSLPAARSASAAFGWMPLWLVGMPLASLATHVVLRLPRRRAPDSSPASRRRRPGTSPEGRRRVASAIRTRDRRAA